MVADVLSPRLQLIKQGTGNNNNAWGDNLNLSVIDRLDAAIAGVLTIAVNTNPYVLTDDEALYNTIILTGTLAADQVIVVNDREKRWNFINNMSGSFFVLIRASNTASPRNLPFGKRTGIISVGSGVVIREDASSVGEYFYYAGTGVPSGGIECNNALLLRASVVDLYGAIGTLHGNTDSLNFRAPPGTDTGRSLRSRQSGTTAGQTQASQNKAHTHTGAGTTSGRSAAHSHFGSGTTGGMNASNPHSHSYVHGFSSTAGPGGGGSLFQSLTGDTTSATDINHAHDYSFNTGTESADHTHTYSFTTSSDGGTEARPESLVAILCVRY